MPQVCEQRLSYLSTMAANGWQWLQKLAKNGSLIALVRLALVLIAQVSLALVLLEPIQLSPRLLLPLSLLICQFAYNLGCNLGCNPFSNPDSELDRCLDCNLGGQAQAQSTTPDASAREKLDAEEAALRHKALRRAHRKRTIETGRNDHVATPEEYAPELELYKKPLKPDNPLGVSNSSSQATENRVELRTDIKLETEKPSNPPAEGSDQFVAKRMHSENSPAAATVAVDFKPYMAALSKKIKQNWTPPARQEKTEVSVNFILMPDGAIGNLRVTKHGSPSADEAARQAILRAAPFAHLPQGCNVPKQIDYDFSHSSHQDNPSFHWGIH
jgi:TonB family protein